jgi:hypothetical protein
VPRDPRRTNEPLDKDYEQAVPEEDNMSVNGRSQDGTLLRLESGSRDGGASWLNAEALERSAHEQLTASGPSFGGFYLPSGGGRKVAQMAPLTVEVALVGDPESHRAGVLADEYFATPYQQRIRIRIDVDESDSLASVMERAAELIGIQGPKWSGGRLDLRNSRIAFYKPEDDQGMAERAMPRLHSSELILVDDRGRAMFGVSDHRAVRIADLTRASEAGTLEGDPLRPYLILDYGWGDVPPPDWATVLDGLKIAREVLEVVGLAQTVSWVGKWLKRRIGRATEALDANPEWRQRGYRPYQFQALIETREWSLEELARLLGCSQEQAEGVLWALGYKYNDESERWERGGDEAAQMLADIQTAIAWAEKELPGWEGRFRRWLHRYVETGECPPFETLRRSFDDDDELLQWKPTPGERLDAFLGRFRR